MLLTLLVLYNAARSMHTRSNKSVGGRLLQVGSCMPTVPRTTNVRLCKGVPMDRCAKAPSVSVPLCALGYKHVRLPVALSCRTDKIGITRRTA